MHMVVPCIAHNSPLCYRSGVPGKAGAVVQPGFTFRAPCTYIRPFDRDYLRHGKVGFAMRCDAAHRIKKPAWPWRKRTRPSVGQNKSSASLHCLTDDPHLPAQCAWLIIYFGSIKWPNISAGSFSVQGLVVFFLFCFIPSGGSPFISEKSQVFSFFNISDSPKREISFICGAGMALFWPRL